VKDAPWEPSIVNNTAGKIIASAKVQLAYAALKGERPDIPFLASTPVLEADASEPARIPDTPNKEPLPIDRLWHGKNGK
jgi:hypothetical protein